MAKENYIPEYDHLFQTNPKDKKPHLISKILKVNMFKVLVSLIIYTIKASPVYIIPLVTADIINVVSNNNPSTQLIPHILICALIIIVLLIQNIPMNALYHKISDNILRQASAKVRSNVVRKLQQLSITYHKEMESGKIGSKFIKDIDSCDMLMNNILKNIFPTIINLVIAICISIYKSGIITLFFILVVPLNVLLTQAFRKKIRTNNRLYRKEMENISSTMTTMLEMIPVTKAHGLEDEEIKRVDTNIDSLKEKALKVDRTNAYFNSFAWCLSVLLSSSCLIFTAILYLVGGYGIEPGDIVLYQSLFGQINGNIQGIINSMPQIASGYEAVSSLNEIMSNDDVEETIGKKKVESVEGYIEFKNVCYRYPNTTSDVIKNFNLKVKKGECIALVGSSGSGKTTIINMVIGFLLSSSGYITIDGVDIKELNLSSYRRNISVVPQNAILFPGTIKENITYGLNLYNEDKLNQVIEDSNLKEFLDILPNGVNTSLKEHASNLSGGQKQRITIARALIRDPSIIIFDEATSALDSISEYHVQEAISKSIKNRTTFIVAHRLSTIRNADRIVVMENGEIMEVGTYDELIAKRGKFYNLKTLNDLTNKKVNESLE